jgi:hypothetical protein
VITPNLVKKIDRATTEEQKLIAQILEAPQPLQHALSDALSQSKNKKASLQFLQDIVDVLVEVNQFVNIPANSNQPTPFDRIVEIFTAKETLNKLAPSDPLAAARLKGVIIKRNLLYEDGQPLKSEDVASLLNVTRQAVDKRRKKGQLLGVSLGRRGYLYPIWQFLDGKVLAGLERVLAQLSEYDPWTQLMFFKTGDLRLDGATPLEQLKAGEIDKVVWAASCYGKQIAA